MSFTTVGSGEGWTIGYNTHDDTGVTLLIISHRTSFVVSTQTLRLTSSEMDAFARSANSVRNIQTKRTARRKKQQQEAL